MGRRKKKESEARKMLVRAWTQEQVGAHDKFKNLSSRRRSSRPSQESLSDAKSQLRGLQVTQMCDFCPKHNF